MDFITKWLTIRSKQKYLGQRYERDVVIDKLVHILLGTAVQLGASRIVFGEPAEPHPQLDNSHLSPPKSDADFEDLKNDEALVGLRTGRPFDDSSPQMIPTWMKINGGWHQSESLPLKLLHTIIFHIEGMCETEVGGLAIDDGKGSVICVDLSIGCEANFNYAIEVRAQYGSNHALNRTDNPAGLSSG